MSQWHETREENIEIDFKARDLEIWVTDNDFGSVYLTLTFDQIKRISDRINANKTPTDPL